jgi:hypothetical protein
MLNRQINLEEVMKVNQSYPGLATCRNQFLHIDTHGRLKLQQHMQPL